MYIFHRYAKLPSMKETEYNLWFTIKNLQLKKFKTSKETVNLSLSFQGFA